VRPADAQSLLDAGALAKALGIHLRKAYRWLSAWDALGIPGIHRVRARGSAGFRYAIEPWFVDEWRACRIPAPRLT